jgi:hypothetical protein
MSTASRIAAAIVVNLAATVASFDLATAGPLPRNWPMPPSELERRFNHEKFEVSGHEPAGSGVTGAMKLALVFPDGKTLTAKWKTALAPFADGLNNSPRKELAAYEMQQWILDENDFIVPTVALRCFPIKKFRAIQENPEPTLADSTCVLGMLAAWMQDVTAPENFYDEKRFEADPLYARYVADLNVLTYLVEHRDTRDGNVLLSTDATDPRVFLADNGVAFDMFPWNLRVTNWFKIRVPWLRRETIDRLRKVDKAKLQSLAVLAELEADAAGVFRVVPAGPKFDDERSSVVRRSGNRVQFGLDEDEIEDVEERIQELLKNVDSGKQPVR